MEYFVKNNEHTYEDDEIPEIVDASSLQDAAEKFAQEYHECYAYETTGEDLFLEVSESKEGPFTKFRVAADFELVCTAFRVTPS